MESKVFISHSSKDKAIADAICTQLESTGIKCWIAPRDIDAGSEWTAGIIHGIDSCRVFILVFSRNANVSEHVRREVAKAFSLGLAVIPFRVENVAPNSSLGYFLETVHWLDASTSPLQKHLDALSERVKQLLAKDGRAPAIDTTGSKRIQSSSFAFGQRARWLFGAILVGATIAIASWFLTQKPRSSVLEIPAKSIAVLPFENISANKEDTYFADGVQDEILNNLAKIAQLKVISRTSVMQYRADSKRDLRQIANATVSLFIGNFEKTLVDAITLLDRAVQLDPKFARAYCKETEAQDLIFTAYDPTPTRRALADAAIENALRLQPDLPEVRLTYAYHLYDAYRDYDRTGIQLAIARRDFPNNSEAMSLQAYMDRRQGKLDKAIQEFNEAITVDPRNPGSISDLAYTLFMTRQLDAAEQEFNRAIDLAPDQPMLKVQKGLYVNFFKTGDNTALRSAMATLPALLAEDQGVLSWRLSCALQDRNWQQATELIELSPGNAKLLSNLAVVDALLGKKQDAIAEGKRAVEMLPISKDAVDGPGILMNLAAVYAWTNESAQAFEQLNILTKIPNGIFYGNLKLDPYWEPLRRDPRFEKLLAELAPRG